MFAKFLWNFRTQRSIWKNFMWSKYCKRQIPVFIQWKGSSQVWKHMLENRETIEQNSWWEPKEGTASIWFDNWINLGPLYLQPSEFQGCYFRKILRFFWQRVVETLILCRITFLITLLSRLDLIWVTLGILKK